MERDHTEKGGAKKRWGGGRGAVPHLPQKWPRAVLPKLKTPLAHSWKALPPPLPQLPALHGCPAPTLTCQGSGFRAQGPAPGAGPSSR